MRSRIVIGVVVAVLICPGCESKEKKYSGIKYQETKLLMGTVVSVDVCYSDSSKDHLRNVYDKIWSRVTDLENSLSAFNEDSDVAAVNNSFKNPKIINHDVYYVISKAKEYSSLSDGAFDITVLPLVSLWRNAQKSGALPTSKEILNAKASVGMNNIKLMPENMVEMLNPNTKIDLGGIAKGYAIDEIARVLRNHGFEDFFIDAGGDLYAGGNSCKGRPWKIGVRDPRDKSKIVDAISVSNAAVVTSGDYERFFEIDGRKWSHIINPVSGYPQKGVASATVIAPNATMADALATSLCVLMPEKGTSLIESLGKGYASFVMTQGAGNTIIKYKSKRYMAINTL